MTINVSEQTDAVRHMSFAPGEFPPAWHEAAFALHCQAWPTPWEGQLTHARFVAELSSDHVDVLCERGCGGNDRGELLALVKWKATQRFHVSRDELSDPALVSLPSAPPAGYVCAYEIDATGDRRWKGLGRRLLSEALDRWQTTHGEAVFCTYSPKRGLTTALQRLATSQQYGRPALDVFAHRAGAAAARHSAEWIARLGQPLETLLRREILPVPNQQIMQHLTELRQRYGPDVIDGVIAALGIAYNFVLRARSGRPACGPAAFHRALGAEHWRQYASSAANCADALGLVDHWRYSHDPDRRERCARLFKEQCARAADRDADPHRLIVLA